LTFSVSTEYNLEIDSDMLAASKSTGKGYQK